MRLTITDQKILFRVSAEELTALLAGEKVEAALRLGSQAFTGRIVPYDGEGGMEAALDSDGITLNVAQSTVRALRDLGRSKDGLSLHHHGTVLALQLDLKTAKRLAG